MIEKQFSDMAISECVLDAFVLNAEGRLSIR